VALALARGFHTVIARASGDNGASIALHEACGFSLVGIEREVGRKFGRWIDVAILQRML
jgi:L-amino acid N-acyltransferase YncA